MHCSQDTAGRPLQRPYRFCTYSRYALLCARPTHPHQYTLSLTTCIKYCPYPFFNIGWAWRSSCSALIQPARKAISSGQATFRP